MLPFGESNRYDTMTAEPYRSGARPGRRDISSVSADGRLRGRCINDMFCMTAINKAEIRVAQGAAFTCPECQKPLHARPAPGRARSRSGRHAQVSLVPDGAVLKGRCDNRRSCTVARADHSIFVRVGNVFVCPECSKPLRSVAESRGMPLWAKTLSGFFVGGLAMLTLSTFAGVPAARHLGFGAATGATARAGDTVLASPAATPQLVDVKPAVPGGDPAVTPIPLSSHATRPRHSAPRPGHGTAHHSAAMAA